jgi:hypothetical protein
VAALAALAIGLGGTLALVLSNGDDQTAKHSRGATAAAATTATTASTPTAPTASSSSGGGSSSSSHGGAGGTATGGGTSTATPPPPGTGLVPADGTVAVVTPLLPAHIDRYGALPDAPHCLAPEDGTTPVLLAWSVANATSVELVYGTGGATATVPATGTRGVFIECGAPAITFTLLAHGPVGAPVSRSITLVA